MEAPGAEQATVEAASKQLCIPVLVEFTGVGDTASLATRVQGGDGAQYPDTLVPYRRLPCHPERPLSRPR